VNIPLLSEVTGAYSLNVNGAYRYSDYSTVGSTDTYAAGLEWRPIEELMVRAQFQRAVRAPNVFELFLGLSNNFPAYTDPCAGGVTGALRTFCISEGIPASVIDTYTEPDSQVEATQGGNPDLSEEESDTYTAGIVWQPSFLEGLSLTVDYYKIEIDDAIDVAGGGANNLIQLCYAGLDAASPECQSITRDANGDIVDVLALNDNISEFTVEGIDFQIQYGWEMDFGLGGAGSNFELALLGTHVKENSFVPAPGLDQVDCEGRFGTPCGQTIVGSATPDNKWNSALTYMTGPLTVRLAWTWIDEVDDKRLDDPLTVKSELPVPTLDDVSYWDLSGRYAFNENFEFLLGVDNLTDEDPPVYGDQSIQSNTDPSTYDVLGRRYWAGLTIKF
jgi:outer membrane receptor protein involved in Fe transport